MLLEDLLPIVRKTINEQGQNINIRRESCWHDVYIFFYGCANCEPFYKLNEDDLIGDLLADDWVIEDEALKKKHGDKDE